MRLHTQASIQTEHLIEVISILECLYWMCLSVCSCAIETTFPLSNLKNDAHIRNAHGPTEVVKTIWDAPGASIFRPTYRRYDGTITFI